MQNSPDFHTPWSYSFLGVTKNLVIEMLLHIKRVAQPRLKKSIIILPSGTEKGNVASYLRAYEVGRELQRNFGWRVTIIPPRLSLKQRLRIIKWESPNLILMQMERHPLNQPHFYRLCPVIFDIDDADFLWDYARPLVKKCCEDSNMVISGSSYIADWVSQYNKKVDIIWTGAKPIASQSDFPSQLGRKKIVVWGHSRPQDYPDEAKFIQDVIIAVAQREPIEYWVFGVNDETTLDLVSKRVNAENIPCRTFGSMSFNEFINELEGGAVGLQFLSPEATYSQGKSFGKVLNYIMAGVVVVASNEAEHPKFFQHKVNGMLASDFNSWVEAIVYLLKNKKERDIMARNAYLDYEDQLSINSIAKQYDSIFRKLL